MVSSGWATVLKRLLLCCIQAELDESAIRAPLQEVRPSRGLIACSYRPGHRGPLKAKRGRWHQVRLGPWLK
jgi:hypothetical protein